MIERIKERLALLEAEQAAYLDNANRQLAAYAAAIAELKALLEPEPPASD